jgi:hypothetical protein
MAVPVGMLATAVATRRAAPAIAAAVMASGLLLLAGRRALRERHAVADEAALDAQIAQSFPASDPSAHW